LDIHGLTQCPKISFFWNFLFLKRHYQTLIFFSLTHSSSVNLKMATQLLPLGMLALIPSGAMISDL